MPTSSTISASSSPTAPATQVSFFADLYTFDWSVLSFRQPAISASAVALCLFAGVALGHPGGALIAGGGALTIGFGVNQRICDSRLLPMVFGVFAMAAATLAGTLAGHRGYAIVVASILSAAIYGVLTLRSSGLAWVGQQASIALFVASAFPSPPRAALVRAALIVFGGAVQILITTQALNLIPELRKDIDCVPRSFHQSLAQARREFARFRKVEPKTVPTPSRAIALIYATRLMLTVALSTELYRRVGMQSGYWIPMTALLVQKPAFFETFTRGLLRVAGTLAGAILSTILMTHIAFQPHTMNWMLAALTTFFTFLAFATYSVNYGLFTLCLTSYIVFLLSLNQIPGPEIAHRRAFCTVAGAAIALLIHLDALRRHSKDHAAT